MKLTWFLRKFSQIQTPTPPDVEFVLTTEYDDNPLRLKGLQFDFEQNKWTFRLEHKSKESSDEPVQENVADRGNN